MGISAILVSNKSVLITKYLCCLISALLPFWEIWKRFARFFWSIMKLQNSVCNIMMRLLAMVDHYRQRLYIMKHDSCQSLLHLLFLLKSLKNQQIYLLEAAPFVFTMMQENTLLRLNRRMNLEKFIQFDNLSKFSSSASCVT